MDKCLHSASSSRAPLVNFEEISCGRVNGRSRGVPWRPCRFPIKQMPAGTRATPQAPASISSCSLGVRQRIYPSLFLSLSWHERVSIVARVVRHAKLELDSPRVHFIRATLTHKSYTRLRLFNAKRQKCAYTLQKFCTYIVFNFFFVNINNLIVRNYLFLSIVKIESM